MAEGSEDKFQKETTYVRGRLSGGALGRVSRPGLYKEYPDSKKIRLPAPEPVKNMLLDEVLKKRRSVRRFSQKPITKGQLSYLLWASSGIQRRKRGYEFRTAPSAGALYPIETYIVVNRVEDLAKIAVQIKTTADSEQILCSNAARATSSPKSPNFNSSKRCDFTE